MATNSDSVINPGDFFGGGGGGTESGIQKNFVLESGIQLKEFGNSPTIGIRNPSSADKESGSMVCNPESRTILDSLTCGRSPYKDICADLG